MNHQHSRPPQLQSLTPEDLVHITALVERDNEGLEQRCARYRRRAAVRRTAMAACCLAISALVTDTAYANPPLYTSIKTCGQMDITHTCNAIEKFITIW